MHKEQEEERKIQETGRQPTSNDSSSDTDKTSGSLFKTSGAGIELSRIKELPTSFYNGYASLDEFLSAASTSDNTIGGGNNVHSKRHHNRLFNGEKKVSVIQTSSGIKTDSASGSSGIKKSLGFKNNAQSATVTDANAKSAKVPGGDQRQGYAQDVIDEMNRQYDHNLCLDRFINDIEQRQQKQKQKKPSVPQTSQQQTKDIDRTCNVSPMSGSSFSSTCSSAVPRSNEDTDSGSRNSESVKSSTAENGKNEKEENEKSKKKKSKKNQTASDESAPSSNIQFSIESGIELASSSAANDNTEENLTADSANDEKAKNYKGGKLGRKRKRGYIYNPKPVIEKPPKQFVPEQAKDQSYWDKRQRNNEAARRSREMRRLKEKETCDKLLRLKKENEALRVAITLLIQRNESLEVIIDEFERPETSQNARVPVTC